MRKKNEDHFAVAHYPDELEIAVSSLGVGDPSKATASGSIPTLLLVADGMGGHGGGELASRIASLTLLDELGRVASSLAPSFRSSAPTASKSEPPQRRASIHGLRDALTAAIVDGDRAIRNAASRGEGPTGMGTTMTVAYLQFPLVYVAHVGDSRCYRLRGGTLEQLTRDHTVAQQLRELNESVGHASRFRHILWNSVGGGNGGGPEPDVRRHTLRAGDTLLLCSDGITDLLSDAQLAELLSSSHEPSDTARAIVDAANREGGSDNLTAVVAWCAVDSASNSPADETTHDIEGRDGT